VFQIITCQSLSPGGVQLLQPFVPAIWQQLFRHCECGEEGTRNVVADCLGKLTLIDPESLLPRLQESLVSDSALMRTTVVTAVKFTISDQVLKCVTDSIVHTCALMKILFIWVPDNFEYNWTLWDQKEEIIKYYFIAFVHTFLSLRNVITRRS
jgi:hypothetical protein